jgi:hypothetical protein
MKNKIKNCLATTGLSLILLAIVATLYQAQFLCITTFYQVLLANAFIHIGLTLLEHFESTYFLLEILVEVGYILIVLIIFGFFFNWYSSTPLWVLILLGIAVYLIGSLISLFRINSNLAFINNQLSSAKHKEPNK